MKRTLCAFAVAALTLAAVSVSQAAPVAPLPAGVAAQHGNLTHVRWRCWWGPHHHRHCHHW
jgi:Spy/CpxP family protein refolding chaperone